MEYGIIGLLVLLLNIWALFKIWTGGSSAGSKIIWTIIILLFPVVGVIVWYFFGPR